MLIHRIALTEPAANEIMADTSPSGGFLFLAFERIQIMRPRFFNLRTLAYIAAFSLLFTLSCGRKSSDKADSNGHESVPVLSETESVEPEITEAPSQDRAVVTVNGIDITESQIEKAMEPELKAVLQNNSNLPPALAEQYKKQLRSQYIERMVNEVLLDKQVKDANVVIPEEVVMAQINGLIADQPEFMSLEEFKEKSTQYGINFDEMKDDVRRRLGYRKLMSIEWEGKINVSEEDARKFYDDNPDKFQRPEQVAASHILIKPDPNIADPNEAKALARAKAEELLQQVKDGADFAELAKTYSDCPSAPKGGDLGFFSRGQMTPAFEDAAFALELGQVSDVVETEYGYHIIKSTGHTDAGIYPYEQVKDNIIKYLIKQQQEEFTDKYIQSLKDKANIVYHNEQESPAQMSDSVENP